MRKLIFLLIAIIFVCLTIFFIDQKLKPSVIINNHIFTIDIAKTEIEKEKGLSIYSTLPKDKAMLFLFDKPSYQNFWMKDMKFSIDIIYINNDRIVDIFPNISYPKSKNEMPISVEPRQAADKVLEINAGLSKKYNFKLGDKVFFLL